jgi:hypothetical protein
MGCISDANVFILKGDYMKKKKAKTVSFDAMMKFFMQKYDIPTRKDINKLMKKIDRLEEVVKKSNQMTVRKAYSAPGGRPSSRYGMTASDMVLGTVKASKKGVDFAGIQTKTGFNDKKLRNIIYRLNKLGRIMRKSRGIYTIP